MPSSRCPAWPADSYNRGDADGAAAPPYPADAEAEQAAEQAAREESLRATPAWREPSLVCSTCAPIGRVG